MKYLVLSVGFLSWPRNPVPPFGIFFFLMISSRLSDVESITNGLYYARTRFSMKNTFAMLFHHAHTREIVSDVPNEMTNLWKMNSFSFVYTIMNEIRENYGDDGRLLID